MCYSRRSDRVSMGLVVLTNQEQELVIALKNAGIPIASATLAIVMVTREHARPQAELADIVRHYPNLEDRSTAEAAIADPKRRGWLIELESYGQYLIQQA